MNTARRLLGGAGLQTAALAFGGRTTAEVANTEEWNGTNWISAPPMATTRQSLAGAGTQTAGLGFGGYTGTANSAATEEWSGPQTTATASNLTTT
jgi:hypothetical protein